MFTPSRYVLRRTRIVAGFVLALAVIPATATGKVVTTPDAHLNALNLTGCEAKYSRLHERVVSKEGAKRAGRDLVTYGALGRDGAPYPISSDRACEEADQLDLILHPPPPPEPTTTYVAAPVSSGGCPASMAGEASSPDAVNPTSGASGCYQVLPSTALAMGPACADVNAPSCVAAICASQGNGAWSASGATPCG